MSTATPTILIQSLIRRAGGSKIKVADKLYHFKPDDATDPDAIHTCAVPVDDAAAIHRFRVIKEGFKILSNEAELPPVPKVVPVQTMAADKAAAPADKAPVTPITIKNEDGDEIVLTDMTKEELQVLARDAFGIKAHHKWTEQVIINKILEATRGEG